MACVVMWAFVTWSEVCCKHSDFICMYVCAVLSSCYVCSLNAVFFPTQAESEPKLTETEKKKLSLQETRRSLPIFPFREDLIQAIKEHQVSCWDVPALPIGVLICTSCNFQEQIPPKLGNYKFTHVIKEPRFGMRN